jgi:hypothetical protein
MAYTCVDYRIGMILAGLRKRLAEGGLTPQEAEETEKEIERLEREMGLD